MFEETVTTENGTTKRVIAASKEDLAAGVKAAKAEKASTTFDINVPVRKGHDLLHYNDDLAVTAVDGTGAHNSPRNAVRDDGSVEGADPLFVVPSAEVATPQVKELVSDGNLKDVSDEDVRAASDKASADVATPVEEFSDKKSSKK